MVTTLSNKTVIIRKDRRCFSCYRKFPIGTEMKRWVGVYEGAINSSYSCITCVKIMEMDSDHEFPDGYVSEMLNKNQTPEDLLIELTHATK